MRASQIFLAGTLVLTPLIAAAQEPPGPTAEDAPPPSTLSPPAQEEEEEEYEEEEEEYEDDYVPPKRNIFDFGSWYCVGHHSTSRHTRLRPASASRQGASTRAETNGWQVHALPRRRVPLVGLLWWCVGWGVVLMVPNSHPCHRIDYILTHRAGAVNQRVHLPRNPPRMSSGRGYDAAHGRRYGRWPRP